VVVPDICKRTVDSPGRIVAIRDPLADILVQIRTVRTLHDVQVRIIKNSAENYPTNRANVVDVALAVHPEVGAPALVADFREVPREILGTVEVAAILLLLVNLAIGQIREILATGQIRGILAIDQIRDSNVEKVEHLSPLVTWIAKPLFRARNLANA